MTGKEQQPRGLERLTALPGLNVEAIVGRLTAPAPDRGRWIVDFVARERVPAAREAAAAAAPPPGV